jgi:hypothetical protein
MSVCEQFIDLRTFIELKLSQTCAGVGANPKPIVQLIDKQ